VIEFTDEMNEQQTLMATTDPDVKRLFWFIDEQFIEEAQSAKRIFDKLGQGLIGCVL